MGFARDSVLFAAEKVGLVHHTAKHTSDFRAFALQRLCLFWIQVFAIQCRLDPMLRLKQFTFHIGEFAYEMPHASSFCPRFCDIGAHGTRGAPNLIAQRECFISLIASPQLNTAH